MTSIRILCVGKIKEQFFRDGIKAALDQIRKKCPVSVIECPDEATPARASLAVEKHIIDREGERILSHISGEDYVIALAIDGRQEDSDRFAKKLRKRIKFLTRSGGSCVFIIGGSLGLSEAVLRRADERLSFSAMTFPHQMMRLILCDQIAAAIGRSGEI